MFFQGVRLRQSHEDLCLIADCPVSAGRHAVSLHFDPSVHAKIEKVDPIAIEKTREKFSSFYDHAKDIEGWLREENAYLLGTTILNMVEQVYLPFAAVEIGSYAGRTSIFVGSVLKSLHPYLKLYTMDPGKLGSTLVASGGADSVNSELFSNIKKAGLAETIEVMPGQPFEIKWDGAPIGFLLVDGSHSYAATAGSFFHLEKYLVDGCVVAFDDYFNKKHSDVRTFVDNLLANRPGEWRLVGSDGALIVLQKSFSTPNDETDILQSRTCFKNDQGKRQFCVSTNIPIPDPMEELTPFVSS